MGGTAYIALSGLRTRFAQLDRLASDLANTRSAGYKAERASMEAAGRPTFDAVLETAVDVRSAQVRTDFRGGEIIPTGRDLDMALDGSGFFVVQTPSGERYTRAGHFKRSADGTLTTPDGSPVMGSSGPVQLGSEPVTIGTDGSIRSSKGELGRLRIVEFDDPKVLLRAGHTQFSAAVTPKSATRTAVEGGALEQSNVEVVQRFAEMTEVARNFEALQRGVSLSMNEMDGRVISELGRR
jgi:flagellar basal-body rod protein FlgF